LLVIVLGLAAGGAIVMQQAINTSLNNAIGSMLWTGVVSYVGGTVSMLLFAAVARAPIPGIDTWARLNAWEWIGGLFGAIYIVIGVFLVPRIGTATFFALFVAGTMGFSLALDHFGAFGIPEKAIDLPRLAGAVLIVAGVVLIRR
jgi:transporter family-2 protein